MERTKREGRKVVIDLFDWRGIVTSGITCIGRERESGVEADLISLSPP